MLIVVLNEVAWLLTEYPSRATITLFSTSRGGDSSGKSSMIDSRRRSCTILAVDAASLPRIGDVNEDATDRGITLVVLKPPVRSVYPNAPDKSALDDRAGRKEPEASSAFEVRIDEYGSVVFINATLACFTSSSKLKSKLASFRHTYSETVMRTSLKSKAHHEPWECERSRC